jgi:glycosyltransferase involved in cell wall biosynthesis
LKKSLTTLVNQEPAVGDVPFSLRAGDPVVVLTHALVAGGAERQWCYLAAGLKAEGYSVTFVVTEGLEASNGHFLPLLVARGIEVIDLSAFKEQSKIGFETVAARRVPAQALPAESPFGWQLGALVDLLTQVQPRAVFAQLDSTNILGAASAMLASVPRVVVSFRNYNPSRFSYLSNDWYLPLYRALCESRCVRMTGNCRPANEDYAAWIGVAPERICWIPNAIDPTSFVRSNEASLGELKRVLRLNGGVPVILGAFRLSEEKQPLVFLDVCARVAKARSEVRVMIAGEGSLREQMMEKIHQLGLEETVVLLGRRTDMAALMSLAHLLLHTSSLEGMSNVCLEAQVLGVPVVATRAGEISSIVEDGTTGFVTPIGDVDALAERCVTILDDPGLAQRMGARARQRMLQHFSVCRLARAYVEALH